MLSARYDQRHQLHLEVSNTLLTHQHIQFLLLIHYGRYKLSSESHHFNFSIKMNNRNAWKTVGVTTSFWNFIQIRRRWLFLFLRPSTSTQLQAKVNQRKCKWLQWRLIQWKLCCGRRRHSLSERLHRQALEKKQEIHHEMRITERQYFL